MLLIIISPVTKFDINIFKNKIFYFRNLEYKVKNSSFHLYKFIVSKKKY